MVRLKYRYLVTHLYCGSGKAVAPDAISPFDLYSGIKQQIREKFGEYGVALAEPYLHVMHFCPITQLCVIRCARESLENVWASLAFVVVVNSVPVTMRVQKVLDVPGSLRTLAQDGPSIFDDYAKRLQSRTNSRSEASLQRLAYDTESHTRLDAAASTLRSTHESVHPDDLKEILDLARQSFVKNITE